MPDPFIGEALEAAGQAAGALPLEQSNFGDADPAADLYENAHGEAPAGNVAGSLLGIGQEVGKQLIPGGHGLYGVAEQAGVPLPEWAGTADKVLHNPDLVTAAGMAAPFTPPGFAENLTKLMAKGLSQEKMANELGVSKATVWRNMIKLGLEPNTTSVEAGIWSDPKNVGTLLQMHGLGASDRDIGNVLGIGPGSVAGKRQRMGLEANNPPGGYGTRRWGGGGEGFAIPMGRPPSMPKTAVPDPKEPPDPWLMQQLGYSPP